MNNLSSTTDNVSSDFVAIINSGIDNTSGDSAGGGHTMYRVRIAAWVTATLLVLATNLPLIILIMKQTSRTFLDWIIITDCMLGVVHMVCSSASQIYTNNFCFIRFIVLFLALINRFINTSISFYRYVFILHNSLVQTKRQRTMFHCLLLSLILLPAVTMTGSTIYYRHHFSCVAPVYLNLPLSHPLKLSLHGSYLASFVVISVCYAAIYR